MCLVSSRGKMVFHVIILTGSLTTPPCSEAVTWIIYPDPLPVSISQVSAVKLDFSYT